MKTNIIFIIENLKIEQVPRSASQPSWPIVSQALYCCTAAAGQTFPEMKATGPSNSQLGPVQLKTTPPDLPGGSACEWHLSPFQLSQKSSGSERTSSLPADIRIFPSRILASDASEFETNFFLPWKKPEIPCWDGAIVSATFVSFVSVHQQNLIVSIKVPYLRCNGIRGCWPEQASKYIQTDLQTNLWETSYQHI